jgi:hypothetical protein
MSRVDVSVAEYVNNHDKAPSGRGYWMFRVGEIGFLARDEMGNANLLFSAARKVAMGFAASQGVYHIAVMS